MEKRTYITLRSIDRVAKQMQQKGIDAFWDGWTLVVHTPNNKAWSSPQGRWHNGTWGFQRRISPRRSDGKWAIPNRYL